MGRSGAISLYPLPTDRTTSARHDCWVT
ncbi:Hypothetical protein PFCIRM516_05125 [Propionibacterium freudenreichii]|uniref:Uncharacterized protein n=1 Tax=Propionibacterium freudenreichii subsp. shermanii (strain ATCC 9614 / DSM 4902 / CIP 103027 / NCIMB 8099 / CIRM-BIA1) TaxID=754252 RepID=D7GF81_PROFC|nr:Hypothetical protein PFREUD_16810 [Propionibacterium freudenreichii subsp. shermanii CIRM-BIA1]CDP48924.1 Hypothetical protein PFCIRM129_05815 [Propionibacterium freudenreichii subsp. freudenreichii]CEG86127.1 Hypothetical protein PFCIRM118_04780 [Propionibacterium freudenreichii]CEG98391.1 Hypothetical protein PFCIRM127_05155 [Propionibacterium freudenreichii]CEI25936.1 Hypothetical protein PFCIRM516_05125 [Propionibacterium freudenreichii]